MNTTLFENLFKNKIFLILFSLSFGIGLRFSYLELSIPTSIFIFICTYVFYAFALALHNFYLIKHDLGVFQNNLKSLRFYFKSRICLAFMIVFIMICSLSIGFLAASLRFYVMSSNDRITETLEKIYVIGQVKQFEMRDSGIRIYLDNVFESNYEGEKVKKMNVGMLRINLRQKVQDEYLIGKWILIQTTLMPPPPPAFPNSFDFSQYAFFKGIGGIGYAFHKPLILNSSEDSSLLNQIDRWINQLRKNVTLKIHNVMLDPAAGIASAILVGENSQIDTDDYYALRVAGLAHIIAISGMHVVVVVAIAFFFIRTILLYLIPIITRYQIALYCSVSKISAMFSILLSAFYVVLSGAPVSAQRALITSSILMLCIVYDRHIHPIKSLCLAAIIMLLLTPEALFAPGLQMSFAACFALIFTFETLIIKLKYKFLEYFLKLICASMAATIATAPFIIYHFSQFAPYGVIANLVCVPMSDFIIMPFGMASMLLMPFGLEKFTLIPVQYSIDFMLWIAKKISILPHADIHVAGFTNIGIITISVGIFVLCISNMKRLRLAGLMMMIFGSMMWITYDNIIVLVSSKIFAVRHDTISSTASNEFIFSSKQKDRFAQEVWQSKLGRHNFASKSMNSYKIKNCNSSFCILNTPLSIIILNAIPTNEIFERCDELQPLLFINLYDDQICDAAENNLTTRNFKQNGNHLIAYDNDELKIITSK